MPPNDSSQSRLEILLKTMLVSNNNFFAMVAGIAAFHTPEMATFLEPIVKDQRRIVDLGMKLVRDASQTEADHEALMNELDALLQQRPSIGFKTK